VLDYHAALVAGGGDPYDPSLTIVGVHPTSAEYDLMGPLVEDATAADQRK
jgi:hypothetical protein